MQAEHSRRMSRPLKLLLIMVALAAQLSAASPAAQAQSAGEEQTLDTRYFTIIYPPGEQAAAEWYSEFADEVNEGVAEMLGNDALSGLTLHIYASEEDYIAANPAAAEHAGIMAHAVPGELEIGVAVERLRQVDPEIARESFRHEMTHVVAGALSGQNLPIGFQEGLAQYNELSTRRGQESAQVMRNAQDAGTRFLSWGTLNDRRFFIQAADLAYPQAYSVMAFLADRYGMGNFSTFLSHLKNNTEWTRALVYSYGRSARALEREWREWLPDFLKDGWQTNLLTYYDLGPGIALYDAGHFQEAAAHFTRSRDLYNELGRTQRAALAGSYLDKAQKAGQAAEAAETARKALESYNYSAARAGAESARDAFSGLGLDDHAQAAEQTFLLAQQGLGALDVFQNAQERMRGFDWLGARSDARRAGEVFAQLGDKARAEEAAKLVMETAQLSTGLGVGVVAVGALAALAGLFAGLRRGAFAPRRQGAWQVAPVPKEKTEWL